MTNPKGIPATILRSPHHSPGDGIGARADRVILTGPGVPELHQANEHTPAVRLTQTTPGYVVAEPVDALPAGHVGYMASGAYIVAAGFGQEWRQILGHDLPIPLHDRSETVELYRLLTSD